MIYKRSTALEQSVRKLLEGLKCIWESDKNTRKHNTQESQEVNPFPAGDHKAARNRKIAQQRQKCNTNRNNPQKKHHLRTVSKKSLEGLNIFNGTNITLNSDVDQDT